MAADLPTPLYHEPDIFQRERAAVFEPAWHMIGRTDQLSEPGDYVAANIGGFPLFALVGEDGAVTGYRNICRHQSLPVLDNGAGSCEALRCRYHGWTYGLDGVLTEAPPIVRPADFGQATYRLATVPTARAAGRLVLIHAAETAPPAEAALAGIGLPALGGLEPAGAKSWAINANWKLATAALLAGFGATGAEELAGGFALTGPGGRLVWAWPGLGAEQPSDGAVAIWQVTPRSFRRTEVALHAFGGPTPALVTRAEEAKLRCEAIQSAFDDGQAKLPFAGLPALAPFRRRVLAALETAPA